MMTRNQHFWLWSPITLPITAVALVISMVMVVGRRVVSDLLKDGR